MKGRVHMEYKQQGTSRAAAAWKIIGESVQKSQDTIADIRRQNIYTPEFVEEKRRELVKDLINHKNSVFDGILLKEIEDEQQKIKAEYAAQKGIEAEALTAAKDEFSAAHMTELEKIVDRYAEDGEMRIELANALGSELRKRGNNSAADTLRNASLYLHNAKTPWVNDARWQEIEHAKKEYKFFRDNNEIFHLGYGTDNHRAVEVGDLL